MIESSRLRALAVFVAAQPALLYGYLLWGGVKEAVSAALLALVAALTPAALRERARARGLLPLAMATAALMGVLGFVGAVWIAPMLLPALVVGLRLRGFAFVRATAAFAAFVAVLSRAHAPAHRALSRRDRAQSGHGVDHDGRGSREPVPPAQRAPGLRHLADRRLPPPPPAHRPDLRADRVVAAAGCAGLVLGLAAPRMGPAAVRRGNGGRLRGCGDGRLAVDRRQGPRDRLAGGARRGDGRDRLALARAGAGSRRPPSCSRSRAVSCGRTRSPTTTSGWRRRASSGSWRRSGSDSRATGRP